MSRRTAIRRFSSPAFRRWTRCLTRSGWNRTWSSNSTRADPEGLSEQTRAALRGRPFYFEPLESRAMTIAPLPEWAAHTAVWIGFPSAADLWEADLAPAQAEVAAFAKAVHSDGKGEAVWLVAADETAAAEARRLA